jgi:hypothetical protein
MKVQALAVAVLAAGLSLAVAGCSGGSTSSGSGSGASSTASGGSTGSGAGTDSGSGSGSGSGGSGSTASGANSGSAGQLTGTQLAKALLPASDFPQSFAVSQQGSADSGSTLEKAAANYNLSTLSCSGWDNYFTSSGFGETAYASGGLSSSAKDQSYGQVVYQFASKSAASAFFTGVQSLSDRCHSFNASGGGGNVTMQLASASSVAGHQAFEINQATTVTGTSSKIDTLFALDGTDVVAISASGVGSAPPTSPAPATLLQDLITKLKAHQ